MGSKADDDKGDDKGTPPPDDDKGDDKGKGAGDQPSEEDIAAVVRRVLSEELPRILAGDDDKGDDDKGDKGDDDKGAPSAKGPRDDEATMYRAVKAAMERLGKEQQLEGRLAQVEEKVKEEAPVQFRRVTRLMGWQDPEPKAKAGKR